MAWQVNGEHTSAAPYDAGDVPAPERVITGPAVHEDDRALPFAVGTVVDANAIHLRIARWGLGGGRRKRPSVSPPGANTRPGDK